MDGKKIKIASMVDEHTQMSLLNIVDRSIPAQRLIEELEKTFAIWGGPPMVWRMDNGPEFISEALRDFCAGSVVKRPGFVGGSRICEGWRAWQHHGSTA
ncbi:transposase family protein, partial [Gordonia alkanivorans]